ncbi:hypothetical protein NDU88_006720 [Pleurodeles waltl]|uniref:Uncharacterized protein n=1 Tax=Pleurodeles waltl TaxID=8319 RepID=A0AAV7MEV0_PLEWA|nr:hypothetical protein NDU88_006720 [Pleurodeles waltl]
MVVSCWRGPRDQAPHSPFFATLPPDSYPLGRHPWVGAHSGTRSDVKHTRRRQRPDSGLRSVLRTRRPQHQLRYGTPVGRTLDRSPPGPCTRGGPLASTNMLLSIFTRSSAVPCCSMSPAARRQSSMAGKASVAFAGISHSGHTGGSSRSHNAGTGAKHLHTAPDTLRAAWLVLQ